MTCANPMVVQIIFFFMMKMYFLENIAFYELLKKVHKIKFFGMVIFWYSYHIMWLPHKLLHGTLIIELSQANLDSISEFRTRQKHKMGSVLLALLKVNLKLPEA